MLQNIPADRGTSAPPHWTPDRRYMVIRGRLWRLSNPHLDAAEHERLVRELMQARRVVRDAEDPSARIAARNQVDAAKRSLGERGEVWWNDGAPDYNRLPIMETPYAQWFQALQVALKP